MRESPCVTCRHEELGKDEKPCVNCWRHDTKWEPKDEFKNGYGRLSLARISAPDTSAEEWKDAVIKYLQTYRDGFDTHCMNSPAYLEGQLHMLNQVIVFLRQN